MGTVFFGGLPHYYRTRDLEHLIARYGPCSNVDLKPRPRFNFGFVDFHNRRDAEDVIRELDGTYVDDNKITVEWTKEKRGFRGRSPSRYDRNRSRSPPRGPRGHSPPRSSRRSPDYRGQSRSPGPRERGGGRSRGAYGGSGANRGAHSRSRSPRKGPCPQSRSASPRPRRMPTADRHGDEGGVIA